MFLGRMYEWMSEQYTAGKNNINYVIKAIKIINKKIKTAYKVTARK